MQNNGDEQNDIDFFVGEWLKRVSDDELNVRAIMKNRDGTPAQVCFLSQQIAEKSLKALMLGLTGDYPKIHTLPQILVMLDAKVSGATELLKNDVTLLNPYYITTRYVADVPLESFTWEMAEGAFSAAGRIKIFVLQKLERQNQNQGGFGVVGVVLMVTCLLIAIGAGWLYMLTKGNFAPRIVGDAISCTQDAKLCSDGSYVSRTGANCEFADCPEEQGATSSPMIDTSDWKTYRNEEYGFEVGYPIGFVKSPDYKLPHGASGDIVQFHEKPYEEGFGVDVPVPVCDVRVGIEDVGVPMSLPEFMMRQPWSNENNKGTEVTINDVIAIYWRGIDGWASNLAGFSIPWAVYVIPGHVKDSGIFYLFSYTAGDANSNIICSKALDQMIFTFKFTK